MSEFVRMIKVGNATVTVINIGDIYLPLAGHMNVSETELARHDDLLGLTEQTTLPIQCIHIQLPQTSMLVDAGVYDIKPDSGYAIPNYGSPPGLVDQLLELGIQPEAIEYVIITHRHWDHFNGTTFESNGQLVPRFPNARYYLGRADWERAETVLLEPDSVEYRTLRVLHDQGLLELVDDHRDLGHGIKIIAAPGETRGHQIVRVHSEGETLYCLGDLYHHPVEFVQSDWMVSWARPETTMASRQALRKAALNEQAMLVATHIKRIGRLQRTATGETWQPV